jgi:hypothetical protein
VRGERWSFRSYLCGFSPPTPRPLWLWLEREAKAGAFAYTGEREEAKAGAFAYTGEREEAKAGAFAYTPPRCGLLCKFFQDAKPKRRRKTAMDANPAPISPRMFGSGIGLAVRERLLKSTLSTGDTVLGFRNPSAPGKNSIPSFPLGIEIPFVY